MLLKAKLTIPGRKQPLVSRPRLIELVRQQLDSGFLLVSAPAGFGKTTLIAEWAAQAGLEVKPSKVAWLTVDEQDNDPVRFLTYLCASLEQVQERSGCEIQNLLQAGGALDVEQVVSQLIGEPDLAPIVIILDDYQHIRSHTVHEILINLLEYRPELWRICITTREDPPFPLARWRVGRCIGEIRESDLRFTTSETAGFFEQMLDTHLKEHDISALQSRTEGWVAGLQLAALSLQDRSDLTEFLDSFTGVNRYVMDYLWEEVLVRQPEHIQQFLQQTAVLDRFNAALCDAVTERADSRAVLPALEQDNLFLIPLDDSREWYRYHRLFADLLLQRLQLSGEDLRPLQLRASGWFAANGSLELAIEYALKAEAWEHVADLIAATGDRLLKTGEAVTLKRWLSTIPEEIIRTRADLCYLYAWVLVLTGEVALAEPYLALVDEAGRSQPELLGQLRTLQAHVARMQQAYPAMIRLSQEALTLLPADDCSTRSVLQLNMGVAMLMAGDLEEAEAALRQARSYAGKCDNRQVSVVSASFLGRLLAARGKLRQALDLLSREREMLDHPPNDLAAVLIDLAAIHTARYDLASAEETLRDGQRLAGRGGRADILAAASQVLARLEMCRGDRAAAQAALETGQRWAHQEQVPAQVRTVLMVTAVELRLADGNVLSARSLAQDAGLACCDPEALNVAFLAIPGCLAPLPGLAIGRLQLAHGEREQAESCFETCVHLAREAGLGTALIRALSWQAVAGATPAAGLDSLGQALELAEVSGDKLAFLDAGTKMEGLLKMAVEQSIHPRYARELLTIIRGRHAAGKEREDQHRRSESGRQGPSALRVGEQHALTNREIEVLALLKERRTNAEIALGLSLTINTVKSHLQHIYQRLDVHNRRAAVTRARELGLLE